MKQSLIQFYWDMFKNNMSIEEYAQLQGMSVEHTTSLLRIAFDFLRDDNPPTVE